MSLLMTRYAISQQYVYDYIVMDASHLILLTVVEDLHLRVYIGRVLHAIQQ